MVGILQHRFTLKSALHSSTSFIAQMTIERQYQGLCESWRVELEEKQRQFEQVKAQILAPRYNVVLKNCKALDSDLR
jgi:hypothetical protein